MYLNKSAICWTLTCLSRSSGIAVHAQRRLVPLEHLFAIAGLLLEQLARFLPQCSVAAHNEISLMPERERPRLDAIALDGLDQHLGAVRIGKHGIGGIHADGG